MSGSRDTIASTEHSDYSYSAAVTRLRDMLHKVSPVQQQQQALVPKPVLFVPPPRVRNLLVISVSFLSLCPGTELSAMISYILNIHFHILTYSQCFSHRESSLDYIVNLLHVIQYTQMRVKCRSKFCERILNRECANLLLSISSFNTVGVA